MDRSIERRRTIRIRRSALTAAKLDDIDKPSIKVAETRDELEQAFRLVYANTMITNAGVAAQSSALLA